MAYLAGSLFGAGADTTAVAIMVVIMAAACFPKAQAKVQEELDTVIGRDRGRSTCELI
jgi:cytochrome P450